MRRSRSWIDVSVPIRNGMPQWPGDEPLRITSTADVERGDEYSSSRATLGWHTGTHMDAPGHFVPGGARIDEFPPEAGLGPARVIVIRHRKMVTAAELRPHRIRRGERVLFRTRNSSFWRTSRPFERDFVAIAEDAALLLVDRQVRFVGIDYLSIDPFDSTAKPAHHLLLGAGIWVVEGLNLSATPAGRYDLACLPLRIEGGDGSPVRALLRPRAPLP